jgi:hypothetical protein
MADDSPSTTGDPYQPARSAPARGRRPRRPRAPGAYTRLALWQRFALAFAVAIALAGAMVIYVDRHNTNSNPSLNVASEVRANKESEILVAQDQAPHTVRLRAGVKPARQLERAIHARLASQVATGAIPGPLEPARCQPSGEPKGGRHAFSCAIVSDNVTYPFVGIADSVGRTLTYCKRDPPPAPTDNVPLSSACRL